MDGPSSGEGRFVSLEWDRGHEQLIAVVHAESSHGVLISEISDLTELRGRRWIRADEIVDIEDLEPDHPARRLARLRGSLPNHTIAEPTDLDSLLRKLQDTAAAIAVYTSRTGSDECLVGSIDAITPDHLVLAEIDANGTATRQDLELLLSAIIAIEWGNDYLAALAALARSWTEGEP